MRHLVAPLLLLFGAAVAGSQPPEPAQLLGDLRKGGHVLFIRHPATESDQADTDPLHLENVKSQRQLSDEGRRQAKVLGEAFRAQKIPVGAVIASEFYRAQEAAKLIDVGEVATSVDVTEGGLVVSPRENQRRAKVLRESLSTAPAEGKNTVIVSHKPNLQEAAGKDFGDLAEGEVVVFKPTGDGKFKLVGRVAPDWWRQWAK